MKPAFLLQPGQDLRGAVLAAPSNVPDLVYWEQSMPYVKELDVLDRAAIEGELEVVGGAHDGGVGVVVELGG